MKPGFKLILYILLLANLLSQLVAADESPLKNNASPYLRMHANDPVNWQLWGKEVLQKAKAENKLLYVSIGYFSCHWCHVMQRESYQDPEIGKFLNKNFIAVKVDRELRPELDRRLIRFVEKLRGQAGWPLNVFVTADGYPVTGFTYLPRDNFYQVLQQLSKQWQERHDEISSVAKQYFEETEKNENRSTRVTLAAEHNAKINAAFISQAMLIADELQGGFGKSMKFPSYPQLNTLLEMSRNNPQMDTDVTDFIRLTLDNMASFNLMDHVNNGFFRYSTDPDWQTPHFEKMLYDNAQLAALYLDAEGLWPGRGYAETGLKTIQFMQQFLADKSGGFNASLSAVDEQNIEGGGYLWTRKELSDNLTQQEYSYLEKIWKLSQITASEFQLRPLTGIGAQNEQTELNLQILDKLRKVKKPVMPVDNKRLASWNGLVLTALVKAVNYHSDPQLQQQMVKQYRFIRDNFLQGDVDKNLQVIRFAGQPDSAETTLEDYAQLAHAIQLYAVHSGDLQAARLAQALVSAAFARFYKNEHWIGDADSLIPGNNGDLIIQDSVLQSPSSLLLDTVFMMKKASPDLLNKAEKLSARLTRDVLDTPYYYGSGILLRANHHLRRAN